MAIEGVRACLQTVGKAADKKHCHPRQSSYCLRQYELQIWDPRALEVLKTLEYANALWIPNRRKYLQTVSISWFGMTLIDDWGASSKKGKEKYIV